MPLNTTTEQDREIIAAKCSVHIENLVAIIEDLDMQIYEWKEASGCESPSELKEMIKRIAGC